MFDLLAEAPRFDEVCPERQEFRDDEWLDRIGSSLVGRIARQLRARGARTRALLAAIAAHEDALRDLDGAALLDQARDLKRLLRREGLLDAHVALAFALVREAAGQRLGMRHFDVQMTGGWIMLNGMIAEMETGEGKTLTATLPACTAALAGMPVHVVTVNDYLVSRDCAQMQPLYAALGLTAGAVTEGMSHAERQAAYRCDVVYCTNKTLVFDYLRDRILLAGGSTTLHLRLENLYGDQARSRRLLLRGLHFAIVDEADSVLVDEARTPLIITAEAAAGDEAAVAQDALALARDLVDGDDFVILRGDHRVALTQSGRQRVDDLCAALGGVWAGAMRREELVVQALTALHLFMRDDHYLVRDGKIQVIDEHTGRVMADRSWGQGLHQLIEAKEGVEPTARRETLARISYQRFFMRYLRLGGMTGTGAEVAGELGTIYGLAVVPVATHRPSRRRHVAAQVFETEAEKWERVALRVEELHATGVPVLLGTRSVAASEQAAGMLAARGLPYRVLNAKQDSEEASIVGHAGEIGCITIATSMAGRGTDIKLGEGVEALGGLHVIISERHEAARIDRQLAGRCARQGDPGCVESILSLQDALLDPYRGGVAEWLLRAALRRAPGAATRLREGWIRYAQLRTERAQSKVRKALLKTDRQMGDILSFSGRPE